MYLLRYVVVRTGVSGFGAIHVAQRIFAGTGVSLSMGAVLGMPSLSMAMILLLTYMTLIDPFLRDSYLFYCVDVFVSSVTKESEKRFT